MILRVSARNLYSVRILYHVFYSIARIVIKELFTLLYFPVTFQYWQMVDSINTYIVIMLKLILLLTYVITPCLKHFCT